MDIKKIIEENKQRLKELRPPYDPLTGEGSPIPRKELSFINTDGTTKTLLLPVEMFADELVKLIEEKKDVREVVKVKYGKVNKETVGKFVRDFTKVRFKYDVEYWAITTVKIQDKRTKKEIPFKLNKPQRKLLGILESMRRAGVPIRIILLKARQWGGSTLVQVYMGWMQILHHQNWHSTVVADTETQARKVKGMYSRLIRNYPKIYGKLTFKNFENSSKIKQIIERGCTIGIGSAQKPDGLRGDDQAMVHETEVAFWKETEGKSPEDLAQTIGSLVPDDVPDTMVVKESTAKGTGNYFEKEYNAAAKGESGYTAVFVPWFEIEIYTKAVEDYTAFIKTWSDYEKFLWASGATIEGIRWYRYHKAIERYDDWRMKSEYPTNPREAFQNTGRRAFAPIYVVKMRTNNRPPVFIGDVFGKSNRGKECLEDIEFHPTPNGALRIWAFPDDSIKMLYRYCTALDIGGRHHKADWSVISVMDRYPLLFGGVPEAILTWRDHLDQDLVIWKAVQIAKAYHNSLFIPESNSVKTKEEETEGDHIFTLLNKIVPIYHNIYCRTSPEDIRKGIPAKYGFHTNTKTKVMLIDDYNEALREEGYIEYDEMASDEADKYEIKEDGSYGAVPGEHDDILMSRTICLWGALSYMPLPKIITPSEPPRTTHISESFI